MEWGGGLVHIQKFLMGTRHGIINFVDTKAKCRHLKNFTCKGRCLSGFTDWRNRQSCWYFRPSFVNCCPFNLLSGSTVPPPSLRQSADIQTVRGGGGGHWVLLKTIFCRSFTLCIWPDSEPTKLLDHPRQKPRRGGGLRQINTYREVPLHVNFLDEVILLCCLYS